MPAIAEPKVGAIEGLRSLYCDLHQLGLNVLKFGIRGFEILNHGCIVNKLSHRHSKLSKKMKIQFVKHPLRCRCRKGQHPHEFFSHHEWNDPACFQGVKIMA